jgi:hypothetical protein
VLCPNSNTSRSKPGWCATRTATSCAWLLGLPPVVRGHAAAGEDPGLGVTVGDAVAVALGRVVAVADGEGAVVGETEREADGMAVGVGEVLAPG